MLATSLRTARTHIALVLAITTTLAFIGADLHVELQGYCDSADDYMLYLGASSMEVGSIAPLPVVPGTGLVALMSSYERGVPLTCVATLDETYSCREHDGVEQSVDRPG